MAKRMTVKELRQLIREVISEQSMSKPVNLTVRRLYGMFADLDHLKGELDRGGEDSDPIRGLQHSVETAIEHYSDAPWREMERSAIDIQPTEERMIG